MSTNKSLFIREYQRKSKSPWDDHSTILLLAQYHKLEGKDVELNFTRYIYQHRNSEGKILGISISKSIQEEHQTLDGQYLQDLDMYMILLLLKEEIQDFCCLFDNEFEAIFGLPPKIYFNIAEQHWTHKLEQYL